MVPLIQAYGKADHDGSSRAEERGGEEEETQEWRGRKGWTTGGAITAATREQMPVNPAFKRQVQEDGCKEDSLDYTVTSHLLPREEEGDGYKVYRFRAHSQ